MPRKIAYKIVGQEYQCETCARTYIATGNSQKRCRECSSVYFGKSHDGRRFMLVSCSDIADAGMIGRYNTRPIWRQLDVVGAILRSGEEWLAYVDGQFMPYYANPQPRYACCARVANSGTAWHDRATNTRGITALGWE